MTTVFTESSFAWTPTAAKAYCRKLARGHYENFTVVSWLLPRDKRQHFYAVYAFCRSVDDLGDEAQGDRLALLSQWEEELRLCYAGAPRHPVMVALHPTIKQFRIPMHPFLKLIEANRIDQRTSRYPTYRDLRHYCEHSANPVGHLVLYILGYRDPQRQRLSDKTCTALQLANFWQDIRRDLEKGRIYLPQEDMVRFGYTEEDLRAYVVNDSFRQLMAFEVQRTRELFREGLKLVDSLDGIAKVDVALFSRGGLSVLQAIEKQGYDVLSRRPTLSRVAKARLFLITLARTKLGMGIPTSSAA